MLRSLIPALAILGIMTTTVNASQVVQTRDHTYYVNVTNSSGRSIWNARASVNESSHSATVRVESQGYRDASQYVSIYPGNRTVYVTVRLEDPSVQARVQDFSGRMISGAWVDQNQFSAPVDEYHLNIRMPQEGFTNFEASHVRVDYVFGAYVYISGSASNRRVEIRIPRRQLGYGNFINLNVRIPSDQELQDGTKIVPVLTARERVRIGNFQRAIAGSL